MSEFVKFTSDSNIPISVKPSSSASINPSNLEVLKGEQGESAYQIALDNGFKGTEQEWLISLKGEKGDRGEKGEQGIQGIQGIQGVQGERGLQGIRGEQGAQGERGKDGKNGYTPIKGVDYFDGKDGANGYTPIKGKDYWTLSDKTEIVNEVINSIPVYNGEVADV